MAFSEKLEELPSPHLSNLVFSYIALKTSETASKWRLKFFFSEKLQGLPIGKGLRPQAPILVI